MNNLKRIAKKDFPIVTGMILILVSGLAGTLHADDPHGRGPKKKPVSGEFDWSIIAPNLPPYLIPGADGDLYLRNMPLVGAFSLTGDGIAITAKISVQLNGELDATGTGVVWSPAVLTATVNGVKTIIFEGSATADTVGLVSTGKATLKGRGPYEGFELEFIFEEVGGVNSDQYTYKGQLSRAPKP